MMSKVQQDNKIIEAHYASLRDGQETITSILQKHPQHSEELKTQLEAISWLDSANQNLEPRQGFISSSRTYLQQKIETQPREKYWKRIFRKYTPQRWVFNISTPVLLILMLVLVINSLILTAHLSIPGDPFYNTKLVIEDVRLAFTVNPIDKTELYIQYSRERTTEIVQLVLEGDYELLPSTANRLETELIASLHSINNISMRNPSAEIPIIASFRDTLSNEIFMLSVLKETSPISARSGIDLAIQVAQSGMMALH